MSHNEYMESIGQLTIDDILSVQESDYTPSTMLKVGDTVCINISRSDELTLNYFQHYYPHVINTTGYVVDSKTLVNGRKIYLVDALGQLHWFNEYELL